MDNDATTGFQQDITTQPPVDLKKFYQDQGIIPKDEAPKVQMPEAAALAAPAAPSANGVPDGGSTGGPGGPTLKAPPKGQPSMGEDVQSAVEGVGKGAADIVKNIYNAGIDAANAFTKISLGTGTARGDLIGDENKIQWSNIAQKPGDPTVEKVFRGLTRYAAPVAAVVGSGGGALAGLAAGAGVDFATLDPHQDRLATMINEKYPDLKNVAVLGNVVDYLAQNDPTKESDFEGRFKNAVEGLLVGGTGFAATEGAVAAFRGAQKVSAQTAQYLASKMPMLAKAGEEAAPAVAAAEPLGEEALAAMEKSYGENSLLSDSPTMTVDGKTMMNPNHGDTISSLGKFVEANRDELNDVKYVPRTGDSVHADAQAILNDPERTQAMFRDTTEQPHTGSEIEAMKAIHDNMTSSVMALADKAAETGAPEDLAAYTNAKANWNAVQNIRTASGSTTGADLNMQSIMKNFMGGKTISQAEAETALQQKKVLIDAINKFSGGEENIADEAAKISAINKLDPAQTQSALNKMNQASQGGWQKTKDTATFVMVNSMLSSFKTFTKVAVSQATTTLGAVADKYMAAALPQWLGGSADLGMKQAGYFARGSMDAFMENMASVGRSLGWSKSEADGVRKFSVDFSGMNPMTSQNYGINPESIYGKTVDMVGQIVGGPSKLVGLHDSIFGQIPYRGTLNQLAETTADKMNLVGDARQAYTSQFLKDPPLEAHQQAVKAAQEATMMGDYADNTLGQIGKGFSKFAGQDVPNGNMIFPFMKIGFNIADYTYQHSPFKALAAAVSPEIRAAMGAPGSAERAMAVAKMANGSLMLGGMTYLASEGLITGEEPKNYEVGRALEESNKGYMPDSIKSPNGYVSLKGIEPLNSYMRLGALMAHAHNYTTADEYQQLVAVAGGMVAESFTPEMLVQNNGNVFDAIKGIYDPTKYGHPVANFASDIASRFVPNILKDVRNVTETTKGDTTPGNYGPFISGVQKISQVLENRVPWLSDNLPIERNKFGEPLLVPAAMPKADVSDWQDRAMSMVSPFAQSSGEKSPLAQGMEVLAKYYEENQPMNSDLKALNVSMPSRTFRMNGVAVPLSPQDYDKYVMYSAGKDPKTGQPYTDAQGNPQDLRTRLEAQIPALVEGMKNKPLDERTYNLIVGKLSGELVRFQKQGDALMMGDPDFHQKYQDALSHTQNTPVNVFGAR